MNHKEYIDTVTHIDGDLLDGALRYREAPDTKRRKTAWKRAFALAASFLLLLTGALVYRHIAPRQPVSTETTNGSSPGEPQTSENGTGSEETRATDRAAVRYTELTADGKGPVLKKGSGMACIAPFSEAMFLNAGSIIIEGTVESTHEKQYHFTVDAPGKFENAGGRMTILYEPQTVITTVRVTKVWLGDGAVNVGDTLTFEDEFLFSDGVFCCREGATYVLYLERADADTLHTGRPHPGSDERLAEGDNRRACEFESGYPYQPAIEKTKDGDYIVPQRWESLTAGTAADVLLTPADVNCVTEDDLLTYRLKLINADEFRTRMQALAGRLKAK